MLHLGGLSGRGPGKTHRMATGTHIDEDLWDEFHRLVNMSSRELSEWLRIRSAGEDTEELPEQAGTPTGQHVLHILSKRRSDLAEDDVRTMRRVVDRITRERTRGNPDPTELDAGDLEATDGAGTDKDSRWRHRLMSLGHDPLKPV